MDAEVQGVLGKGRQSEWKGGRREREEKRDAVVYSAALCSAQESGAVVYICAA